MQNCALIDSAVTGQVGQTAIQRRLWIYRETHKVLDNLAEATFEDTRTKPIELLGLLTSFSLLIINDLATRKLPVTVAEDVLENGMRSSEWAGIFISN
jgi:DNA replication protein DnaC